MQETIKNSFYGILAIGFFVLTIIGFILLIVGGAKLFEVLYPFLEWISSFTWGVVWLLLLFSIVPRFRNFTGTGIMIGTYIGGAIFWLLCFYITYSLWGVFGIFVGVLFMGIGVFFTAVLALLFSGQFGAGFYFIFILVQIYIFRKYRRKSELKMNEKTKKYLRYTLVIFMILTTLSYWGEKAFNFIVEDDSFAEICYPD